MRFENFCFWGFCYGSEISSYLTHLNLAQADIDLRNHSVGYNGGLFRLKFSILYPMSASGHMERKSTTESETNWQTCWLPKAWDINHKCNFSGVTWFYMLKFLIVHLETTRGISLRPQNWWMPGLTGALIPFCFCNSFLRIRVEVYYLPSGQFHSQCWIWYVDKQRTSVFTGISLASVMKMKFSLSHFSKTNKKVIRYFSFSYSRAEKIPDKTVNQNLKQNSSVPSKDQEAEHKCI